MEKQGQIKIQQMAFMILALTIFFVIVGLFVLVIRFAGIKEDAASLEEKNALLLVTKLANSPEFACGDVFGTGNINCIDGDKVMALKKNIEKYKEFWGDKFSNIEIRKLYPAETEKLCEFGNYPECNLIRIVSGETIGFTNENFVSLCRKSSESGIPYDKCEMAKIFISYNE